ncbi:hypothetical protein BH11BAC4_BH11BAC4_07020 [soil metagenome]
MKEVVYKILDLFTGSKGLKKTINGFTIKLPTRYVNYFPANYEADNFSFLRKHTGLGDHVLDIGAHIGLFAVAAAQIAGSEGKVYAFEPADETRQLLQQTIAINHFENVITPYAEAMGAKSGKITFYVSPIKGDNSNSLVSYKQDRKLIPVEVDMFSIDDFIEQKKISKPAFIKIDVEGAEYDALKGAIATLKNLKPACIVAIHPEPIAAKGDSLAAIYELIIGCGYDIYFENRLIDKTFFCNNKEMIDLHILPH